MQKLQDIAIDTVDIKGIGFYTLGSIRKSLNDTDKKKYSILFEQYFLKSFLVDWLNIPIPKLMFLVKKF